MVTSDRISAFDVVFPNTIPNNGKILNQISVYFFKQTKDIIENHFITDNVDEYPVELLPFKEALEHRSMLVKKTKVIPFECIVRGYITGSAWKEYRVTKTIGGAASEANLQESEKFPEPIFTPSTKAEEGHDENISYEEMKERIDNSLAEELKAKSLKLYNYADEYLKERGIIIADTKLEFGTLDGKIILIDEILTPDSSRFWEMSSYKIGTTPKSFDKQIVRDYISSTGWDKNPPAPKLPQEIIINSYEKYYEIYKNIVGDEALKWH